MMSRKRNICTVHGFIYTLARDLEREYGERLPKIAQAKLARIQTLAEEAKDYGQAMEDRLLEYRDGVENLGFKRV